MSTVHHAARPTDRTAPTQAREVAVEATTRARQVAADVRQKVGEQARAQNERLADFARRRPGTFLAVALAAGFVIGRSGKSLLSASATEPTRKEPPS